MKTIILYASKYGATKEVADIIATKLPEARVEDIKQFKGNIKDYQNVVLGSRTTAGTINKKIKDIYTQLDLTTQKLTIFIVGMQKESLQQVVEQNFAKEVVPYSYFVGGKLNFLKMNFAEKAIIKAINKKAHMIDNIDSKKEYDFLDYPEIEKMIINI